ncbi:MAG: hypothetical protein WAP35_04000 [Solirubrobacterales bacterium]
MNAIGALAVVVGLGDWLALTLMAVVMFVGIGIFRFSDGSSSGDLVALRAKQSRGRVAIARNHAIALPQPEEQVVAAAFGWLDRSADAARRGGLIVATGQRLFIVGDDSAEPVLDCTYPTIRSSRIELNKMLGTHHLYLTLGAEADAERSIRVANILERNGIDVHLAIQERIRHHAK